MLLTASLGLLIDIPLGVVIHLGGFCMHSGFRQVLKAERFSSFLASGPGSVIKCPMSECFFQPSGTFTLLGWF